MTIQKIYIGGWFQRTTLHLTEIWDFLKYGKTNLNLQKDKLDLAKNELDIKEVTRQNGLLEYIQIETNSKINYRIYEDGLIILEKDFDELENDFESIKQYYDEKLSKSLSLIFSKGAPVPKELANIKTILPYIIMASDAKKEEAEKLFKNQNEDIYSALSTDKTEVYRSSGIILINNLENKGLAREIIESEIFFREFKTQLGRYLSIHRTIWEKIEKIKEVKKIKGNQIEKLRNELAIYQKTINLISARIEQMDTYILTRQRVTGLQKIDDNLKEIFQFKFETLIDTHEYIKDLWQMTNHYLASAIELLTSLQAESTKNTISSLQLITSIGVVAGIISYLESDRLPNFTIVGILYFFLLLFVALIINNFLSSFYRNKKFNVQDQGINKNI